MLAGDITVRVRDLVNDPTGVRWPDAELLRYISDGQLFITNYRPDATAATQTLTLAAGSKQALPATGLRLLDVIRSYKADGTTIASGISYIDRQALDGFRPGWHTAAASATVRHVIYDNRAPKEFWVYPPATVGAKIDVLLAQLPTDVTATGSALTISDAYRDMVVSYVCFRCYCKDTEARSDKAQMHLSALGMALGIKLQKDAVFQPDLNNKGGSPNAVAIKAGGV
jgi:hypothetical protein